MKRINLSKLNKRQTKSLQHGLDAIKVLTYVVPRLLSYMNYICNNRRQLTISPSKKTVPYLNNNYPYPCLPNLKNQTMYYHLHLTY